MTHGTYDPVLVIVSVLIAIFASYTALDLAGSVSAARGRLRLLWLSGGSLAMGVGIWSMHFVGMLAFHLPNVPISYDITLLNLSIAVAIFGSWLALIVVSRARVTFLPLSGAALAMGAAICGMHYIGIWSMRLPARIFWSAQLIAASILIAIAAAFVALWLAFRFRRETAAGRGYWHRLGGGVVMGLAIAGMHYTAMLAMRFTPLALGTTMRSEEVLATDGLAIAVTGTTILILAIALAGSVVERAMVIRTLRADEAERRAHVETALRHELEENEQRVRILADASNVLASSLDYQVTLQSVARLAVEHVADYCLVDIREDDGGRIRRVAVAHRDSSREETLRRAEPFPPGLRSPLSDALDEGRSRLVTDVTDEMLRVIARDEQQMASMRGLFPRSLMVVPLQTRGQTLGLMTFVSTARRFATDDLTLAEELARRAAAAVDNARLYKTALAADQAKSDFLAVVSHELRTPLNAIIGYADLMELSVDGVLSESHKEQVRRIKASSYHLLGLIEGILTFSGTEADKQRVSPERVDLTGLIRDVAAMAAPLAAEKGLRFELQLSDDPCLIETDPGMVRQILLNLLGNAVKFTEKGRITVRSRLEGDHVLIEVRDTGIGIAPEHIDRIFAPFWQLEQGTTRRTSGTGLGLSVTQRLLSLLGGDISVESEPGKGSTFTARLPLKTHATPA